MTDERKLPQGRLSRFARLAATGVRNGGRAPLRPRRERDREAGGRSARDAPRAGGEDRPDGELRGRGRPGRAPPGLRDRALGAPAAGPDIVARGDPRCGRARPRRADWTALRRVGRRPGRERVDRAGAPRAAPGRARGRGQGAAPRASSARSRATSPAPAILENPRRPRRGAQVPVEGRPRRHQAAVPRRARLRARGGQHHATSPSVHAGDPTVRIPALVASHSRKHVLTTEFVRGLSFEAACAASENERRAWAETMWRFVFKGNLLGGRFNADPHPGNYIFHDGGRITFLDYGCVQPIDPARQHGPTCSTGRPSRATSRRSAARCAG